MNETLHLGITLMVISLVAGAALALTNKYTVPEIEKQKGLAMKDALNKVINADSFKQKNSYYEAYDKDGKLIGRVAKVEAIGYSSIINALVGVDLNNKITGIGIISQQETPGLGSNIEKESFLSQFIGKGIEDLNIKKDGGKIDAVTGATISSRAITSGVRNAIENRGGTADAVASTTSQNYAQNQTTAAPKGTEKDIETGDEKEENEIGDDDIETDDRMQENEKDDEDEPE